jgi:hypothetical protein
MSVKEFRQIDNGIKSIEGSKHNLETQLLLAKKGNINLAVTTLSPVSSLPVLSTGFYGTVDSKLSVTAAQGEYEPASFVIHAVKGAKALTVAASDLKQGKNVIPASNIDIKAVKCWYQAGTQMVVAPIVTG